MTYDYFAKPPTETMLVHRGLKYKSGGGGWCQSSEGGSGVMRLTDLGIGLLKIFIDSIIHYNNRAGKWYIQGLRALRTLLAFR
ncbi:hypothetical protein Pan258_07820 [Symmachiella dynata]|uniref:hypothetical protein n=1 Tax=Symmachiella dynata TaxID=2527995 RepID=UPI00118AC352|nr:hypothetical protein [Symmachiella dynata]QDT46762.1 hypothetical protein Pan258_07820 [Symmachiella dynata]